MTKLLEKAVAELEKLPGKEQDAIAHSLLREVKSEHRWAELFTQSADLLSDLADEALAEHADSRTVELKPDEL